MNRREFMLAALSSAEGGSFSAVQVQKLFFLLDKTIPKTIGGPLFRFEPYNYGPFDKDVYSELEALRDEHMIEIEGDGSSRRYRPTPSGLGSGAALLSTFRDPIRDYVQKTSAYVRSLSFSQLVSAIYRAYPEMKQNSVFQS